MYPFKLFLQRPRHVNRFLVDGFDGEDFALVHSDGTVNSRITEVRIRIGTKRHLARSQERMQRLQIEYKMSYSNGG